MTDYTSAISQILNAQSLAAIEQIVIGYSAQATGAGGVLYSGYVGSVQAHDIALDLVRANAQNGVAINIIDNTPRGLLLSDGGVLQAIRTASQNIFVRQQGRLCT